MKGRLDSNKRRYGELGDYFMTCLFTWIFGYFAWLHITGDGILKSFIMPPLFYVACVLSFFGVIIIAIVLSGSMLVTIIIKDVVSRKVSKEDLNTVMLVICVLTVLMALVLPMMLFPEIPLY